MDTKQGRLVGAEPLFEQVDQELASVHRWLADYFGVSNDPHRVEP
jgi:hypothetical protein